MRLSSNVAILTGKMPFMKVTGLALAWTVETAPRIMLLSSGLRIIVRAPWGKSFLPGAISPRSERQKSLMMGGTTPLCVWPEIKKSNSYNLAMTSGSFTWTGEWMRAILILCLGRLEINCWSMLAKSESIMSRSSLPG